MKYLKMLGLATVTAVALTAFTAANASATTLEIGGVKQNQAVEFTASLEPGTTFVTSNTSESLSNTCQKWVFGGTTSLFTGQRVTGALNEFSLTECTHDPVTVETGGLGQLYVEHIAGTTNGTVFWENQKLTVPTSIGNTVHVTCTTGNGTHVGTLTGATTASNPSASATIDIKAVINCGFLLPSALWQTAFVITTPSELGVSA